LISAFLIDGDGKVDTQGWKSDVAGSRGSVKPVYAASPNGFSGCSAAAAQLTNFMEFVSLSWRKDVGGYQVSTEGSLADTPFDNA
jgi:hypothetical protein